jgi:hypothetical protein
MVPRPDLPAMSFDDRATDGKTHAETVTLGSVKRLEYTVEVLAESHAAVAHRH